MCNMRERIEAVPFGTDLHGLMTGEQLTAFNEHGSRPKRPFINCEENFENKNKKLCKTLCLEKSAKELVEVPVEDDFRTASLAAIGDIDDILGSFPDEISADFNESAEEFIGMPMEYDFDTASLTGDFDSDDIDHFHESFLDDVSRESNLNPISRATSSMSDATLDAAIELCRRFSGSVSERNEGRELNEEERFCLSKEKKQSISIPKPSRLIEIESSPRARSNRNFHGVCLLYTAPLKEDGTKTCDKKKSLKKNGESSNLRAKPKSTSLPTILKRFVHVEERSLSTEQKKMHKMWVNKRKRCLTGHKGHKCPAKSEAAKRKVRNNGRFDSKDTILCYG